MVDRFKALLKRAVSRVALLTLFTASGTVLAGEKANDQEKQREKVTRAAKKRYLNPSQSEFTPEEMKNLKEDKAMLIPRQLIAMLTLAQGHKLHGENRVLPTLPLGESYIAQSLYFSGKQGALTSFTGPAKFFNVDLYSTAIDAKVHVQEQLGKLSGQSPLTRNGSKVSATKVPETRKQRVRDLTKKLEEIAAQERQTAAVSRVLKTDPSTQQAIAKAVREMSKGPSK